MNFFQNALQTEKYFSKCCEMIFDIKPKNTVSGVYMMLLLIRSPYIFSAMKMSSEEIDERQCAVKWFTRELTALVAKIKGHISLEETTSYPLHGALEGLYYLISTRPQK